MEFITYEMFGAVGDGAADDMPAIVKAHAEANLRNLPIRAREGAIYYLSPKDRSATVQTSADWTGARFIIDDVGCENRQSPIFSVASALDPLPLSMGSLARGQTHADNPYGRDLYCMVYNENHLDYIRRGLNQSNGQPRRDNFILHADGSLSSPLSFDFSEVTRAIALPIDGETLTLTGGEFTTIVNQEASAYNYYARNITIARSNVEVARIVHRVTGELEHGAPYSGFINVSGCARVTVRDCLFTAHRIYSTIGSAGLPVPMGSYDITLSMAADVTFARCQQTTDILDRNYWGLIGSNFCRDLTFEDCVFSRFDAHCGVTNCTLRRCTLGWQGLNAIGFGTFLIEDTETYGHAFVSLRFDYGSTWRGDMLIRGCTWRPLGTSRAIFCGGNDGTHDFGYECYMPQRVDIDGLTVTEETGAKADGPLYIFNDYGGETRIPARERRCMPKPPTSVRVKNVATRREILLCPAPALMPDAAMDIVTHQGA